MINDDLLRLYKKLFFNQDLSMHNLASLAQRLSALANRDKPWSAKMLHSIIRQHTGFQGYHNGTLSLAIGLLEAEIDGSPYAVTIVNNILSYHTLPPGTIIQGKLVQCSCGVYFVPAWANQKYHTKRCKQVAQNERRRAKRHELLNYEG